MDLISLAVLGLNVNRVFTHCGGVAGKFVHVDARLQFPSIAGIARHVALKDQEGCHMCILYSIRYTVQCV